MKDWQWYALAAVAVAAGWYVYRSRQGEAGGGGDVPETHEIGNAGDSLGDLDSVNGYGGQVSLEV